MNTNKILVLFLATITLCGCNKDVGKTQLNEPDNKAVASTTQDTITLTSEQVQAVGIQIGQVEERVLEEIIRTNGYLRLPPQNIAQVSVLMGGMIKLINVKEEDYIQRGKALAYMEHPDFTKLQESYLTTKTNYSVLEAEYLRQKELFESNLGAGKTFQQSEANYFAEKARLASLENQLRMIGISVEEVLKGHIISLIPVLSPISGYVTQINVNTGTIAQPGVMMFEVIDNQALRAELIVYEKDLYKVKEKQDVTMFLTNQDYRAVQGKISAVGKMLASETKSTIVFAKIDNKPGSSLVHGIYVNAHIDVGQHKSLTVPVDAVVRTDGKEYIFKLINKRKSGELELYDFSMVEVSAGISENGFVSISSTDEIAAHSKVVTKGTFFVLSKSMEGANQDE